MLFFVACQLTSGLNPRDLNDTRPPIRMNQIKPKETLRWPLLLALLMVALGQAGCGPDEPEPPSAAQTKPQPAPKRPCRFRGWRYVNDATGLEPSLASNRKHALSAQVGDKFDTSKAS